MCLSMTNTCHLGSSPLFPRGDLRGYPSLNQRLQDPPVVPPWKRGDALNRYQFNFFTPFRGAGGCPLLNAALETGRTPPYAPLGRGDFQESHSCRIGVN